MKLNKVFILLSHVCINLQLSLFFDILLCMGNDVTEENFVSGELSRDYDKVHRKWLIEGSEVMAMKTARSLLWKQLRGIEMRAGK